MKKIILGFLAVLFAASVFAMPGFESYILDRSGTYVYYRDYSFERESYIGILTYDEATFQIRYYAPKDEKSMLPEKEVALLLSINPEAVYWQMTGEKIISQILPNDDSLDILNYLHDILYEFSARRIKIGELNPKTDGYVLGNDFWENGIKASQEYPQFGGKVTISFDCMIPLFNLKSITAADGSTALQVCVIGDLKSDDDVSFESFKGFKEVPSETITKNAQIYKKAKSLKNTFANHSVTIDSNWTTFPDSATFCVLNDDAVITMVETPKCADDPIKNDMMILGGYITSIYYHYINLLTCDIVYNDKNNSYKIIYNSYPQDPDDYANYIYAVEILTKNERGGFDFFSLSTYKRAYLANRSYFEKIIKSYK